jgi:hypothetical protein
MNWQYFCVRRQPLGEGMIFAENGQFLTYTAKDTGLADKEGNFIYKGAMIFDSNEMSGQFADLDNQIGPYITWLVIMEPSGRRHGYGSER